MKYSNIIKNICQNHLGFGPLASNLDRRFSKFISHIDPYTHLCLLAKDRMARSFIAAASKIAAAIKAGKIILLVTDQIAAFPEVIKLHQESQVAYLFNSWIPGFYSNFQQIHASVQQVQHNISLLDVYNTKKERNIAQKHLNKARLRYSGIWQLQDKPDLIILCCSPQKTLRILKEVKNSEVKIISLYDCSRQSLPILTSSKLKYVYSALNSSAVQLLISIINYHLNKVDATSDK